MKNTFRNLFKGNKKVHVIVTVLILVVIVGAYLIMEKNKNPVVTIETSQGNIKLELYPEKAPVTVENFLKYSKEGFYENTIFHRVIEGFMIQGGGFLENGMQKPTNSPIRIESNNGLKNLKGTIAMARTSDPNSATSQFFINLQDNDFLNYGFRDEGYTVFGKVVEGMDVVEKIGKVETTTKNRMEDWPVVEVKILKVRVE